MQAYLISKEILEKNNLSLKEYCTLMSLKENLKYNIDEDALSSLQSKKFIKLNNSVVSFRNKTTKLFSLLRKEVDFLGEKIDIISKRTEREVNEEIKQRVQEYRNLFKGYKAGSMGSLTNCKNNLSKFLKNNPDYTFNDIIKATKIYINSVDNLKYLHRADYFIYKEQKDKTVVSTLEAYIDESEDKSDNEWTSKLT